MKRFIPLSIMAANIISFGLIAVLQNKEHKTLKKDNNKLEVIEKDKTISSPDEEDIISTDNNYYSENNDTKINSYVVEQEQEVEKLSNEPTSEDNKSKLRQSFITLTDFIFYDGEIKGVKFKDLTESTEEKILNLWYKLDSKIDEKYPDQKEEIKSTTKYSYNTIKSKASELKDKVIDKCKESVGEDKYNSQVEKGNEVKEKTKEKATSIKDKISNWYKNLKEGE